MPKFNSYRDRIEFMGTSLVNAQREGKCSWCGRETVWYDLLLREFLCGEECTQKRHIEVSEWKRRGG